MNKLEYPSIEKLRDLYQKYDISILVSKAEFLSDRHYYPAVKFNIGKSQFHLFVDDEYEDLPTNNPLLNLCLVLRELEDYDYAIDYLEWCKHHSFDVSNKEVNEYFSRLGKLYTEVEKIIGKINSQVSDYDFELNAGAAQKLREVEKK